MKQKLWQTFQFGKYLLRSFHLHGIHSPFIYELNEVVFKEKTRFYAFDEVEAIRSKLLLTHKEIKVLDLGAGSQVNNSKTRKISQIAKSALKSPKNAQVLFRLVQKFKPNTILEIGTSLGITTCYLARSNKASNIFTLEGSPEITKVAQINFNKLGIKNVNQIVGNFNETLSETLKSIKVLDFVFFDGNHQKTPTLAYFNECLKKADENSIFVFDDIYWSKEMTTAWKEIKRHEKVVVTIDCFEMGIVFFKKDQAKEHFTVYH